MIKAFKGVAPEVSNGAYIEESAQVIGKVVMGEQSSVWFNAVVRGDVNRIEIGDRTNVQDGTVVHVTCHHPTLIGNDVTIGHNTTIHGCTIGDRCLIGMGAVLLDGVSIGDDVIIAAGAIVSPGTHIPDGQMALGTPACVRRPLTDREKAHLIQSAKNYVQYKNDYQDETHQDKRPDINQ